LQEIGDSQKFILLACLQNQKLFEVFSKYRSKVLVQNFPPIAMGAGVENEKYD
jgi:hypothetical protein